jgi:uncharacterized protein (DUF1800 family)
MGAHPELLTTLRDTDAATARALDLSAPAATPITFPAPADSDTARNLAAIGAPIVWWLGRMQSDERLVEERLVWFWHDHFATSLAKVRVPYLMWQQHLTLRQHATGNYADLLKAMARDPAMLVYLDGVTNTVQQRNENFGREVLELFTMGRDGGYTQDDVVAASRAFTGWTVNIPGRPGTQVANSSPWNASLVARRHDAGAKTFLGKTGSFDMDGALDVILGHPSTARFVAAKLYRELVGLVPDDATTDRLAKSFRRDYAVMPLVEAIVGDKAFTSDVAVRAKYRTPVEKLVGIMQATGTSSVALGQVRPGAAQQNRAGGVTTALRTMSYLPFLPPNVGGYPKGARLLGPSNLVHSFDLLQVATAPPTRRQSVDEVFAQLGVFDVSDRSRHVVGNEKDPARRLALAVTSPEYTLT